jgi:hypothetical protein
VEADPSLVRRVVPIDGRNGALRRLEEPLGQLDDLRVGHVPRRGDHQVGAHIPVAVVLGDLRDRDRCDHVGLAKDSPAQRMVPVDGLGEKVVHAIRRLVLVHRDLLEHDLALGVDLRESRAEHHLGHQVERVLGVLVEEAGVDVRGLLARRRVGRGAHAVEALGDVDRRVALRSLEQQMFQEVREPLLSRALVA